MKTPVYLIHNEMSLRKRGNNLIVVDRGREFPIPINSIDYIVRNGNAQITAQVFNYLGEHNIPVIMTTWGGKLIGIFYPPESNFNKHKKEQYNACSNDNFRLKISKSIISASLINKSYILELLLLNPSKIKIQIKKIIKCISSQEIMLCEAQAAKYYYSQLNLKLKKWGLPNRTYNPPSNQTNAMLSYCYSLLYSEISARCHEHGLCNFMGVLHEMNDSNLALVYDISEIFKPLIDNFVIDLINNDLINDDCFISHTESCFLNNSGKNIILKEWFAFIRKTYNVSDKLMSFREIIRREVLNIRESFVSGSFYGWTPEN